MLKYLKPLAASGMLVCVSDAPGHAEKFGLGRAATPGEIAAWDVDVAPDGTGLPTGSGDVLTGEELFSDKCAACHGEFAEGVDNWPELAGGEDTLAEKDPVKTVGSYWPYLSTVWDYVHRSMPFGAAQTLSDDDVYAIVAYILYSNDLVDEDFVLSNESFFDVAMPNAEGFVIDDREVSEQAFWNGAPCMSDCKENVEITMRAAVLDVTPEDETAAEATMQPASAAMAETHSETPAAETPDPAVIAAGEKVFKKCKACHQVGDGAKNRSGPVLNGIFGRTAGTVEKFKYSKAMAEAGANGLVWDDENFAAFMENPKGYIKKTKMSFKGLNKPDDISALAAYLKTFGQ